MKTSHFLIAIFFGFAAGWVLLSVGTQELPAQAQHAPVVQHAPAATATAAPSAETSVLRR